MKKLIGSLLLAALGVQLFATPTTKSSYDLSYDAGKGWYWYEEKVIDSETKEETTVKFKVTPKEKVKMDMDKKLMALLEKQVEKQDEILKRLEYAFPNVTPIYTTNKKTGEKCLTNSSMDCFVMPVIAEGQQIPALKDFLRNPSPDNSKNWLQWQATYFNHVQKVSHGLRFAYLKHGADAYPTTTTYSRGDSVVDSQSENALAHREAKVIHSLKDKIGLFFFVGKNELYEKANKVYAQVHNWNKSFLKDMDTAFIFDSEKSRETFFNEIKRYGAMGEEDVLNFWRNAKIAIRPDLFKQYKISMSPTAVMFYDANVNGKHTSINSTIASGTLSSDVLRRQMRHFLTYNEIVEEREFAAENNWESPETKYPTKKPKVDDSKVYLEKK